METVARLMPSMILDRVWWGDGSTRVSLAEGQVRADPEARTPYTGLSSGWSCYTLSI